MPIVLLVFFVLAELPYDRVDQDGDGVDLTDVDRDGFASVLAFGADCADRDPLVHPEALDLRGDRLDADCGGSDGPDHRPRIGLIRARRGAPGAARR